MQCCSPLWTCGSSKWPGRRAYFIFSFLTFSWLKIRIISVGFLYSHLHELILLVWIRTVKLYLFFIICNLLSNSETDHWKLGQFLSFLFDTMSIKLIEVVDTQSNDRRKVAWLTLSLIVAYCFYLPSSVWYIF